MMVELKVSPLHQYHVRNAHLSEFAGYQLPIWYDSVSGEHKAVRANCGLFDISHMGRIGIEGTRATEHLNNIVPTDISRLEINRSLYSTLLDTDAGIVDDVVILRLGEDHYLVVGNAINLLKDLEYLKLTNTQYATMITDVTMRTAMIAIQGPQAESIMDSALNLSLRDIKKFEFVTETVLGVEVIISRTGYTGEDGFEVISENGDDMFKIWDRLLINRPVGPQACGLGSRDTLRLEAGFPLYGYELNQEITPVEAGLGWLVSRNKITFLGKRKIEEQMEFGTVKKRVGLVMQERGIPRHGYGIESEDGVLGSVTSGTYSPILRTGIAMGYVNSEMVKDSTDVLIIMKDGKAKQAKITRPPFYDTSKYGRERTKERYSRSDKS